VEVHPFCAGPVLRTWRLFLSHPISNRRLSECVLREGIAQHIAILVPQRVRVNLLWVYSRLAWAILQRLSSAQFLISLHELSFTWCVTENSPGRPSPFRLSQSRLRSSLQEPLTHVHHPQASDDRRIRKLVASIEGELWMRYLHRTASHVAVTE
jgi:hypothetical protein